MHVWTRPEERQWYGGDQSGDLWMEVRDREDAKHGEGTPDGNS